MKTSRCVAGFQSFLYVFVRSSLIKSVPPSLRLFIFSKSSVWEVWKTQEWYVLRFILVPRLKLMNKQCKWDEFFYVSTRTWLEGSEEGSLYTDTRYTYTYKYTKRKQTQRYTYIQKYRHADISTHTHKFYYVHRQTHTHTNIYAGKSTYIHTYIYTNTHTYMHKRLHKT